MHSSYLRFCTNESTHCDSINDSCKQEVSAPPQSKVYTNPEPTLSSTLKQEPTQEHSIKRNWEKLIKLNPDQISNLRFPSGMSVRWDVMVNNNCGTKEGTVNTVYFDIDSSNLLYEVFSKHKGEPFFFSESDLGYAPPCSIFVCPDNAMDQTARDLLYKREDLQQGSLLSCSRRGGEWLYTVEITDDETGIIKRLENVPSKNVYRNSASPE